MDISIQVLLYSLLFIASGIVILHTLDRSKMKTAWTLFAVLFIVMLLYIPFYFGGSALTKVFVNIYKSDYAARMFMNLMHETLTAPFIFFKSLSLGSAVLAIVFFAASLIVAAFLTVKVVKLIRGFCRGTTFVRRPRRTRTFCEFAYIINYQNIYKRLARLLN